MKRSKLSPMSIVMVVMVLFREQPDEHGRR
jgi:hypothetical protein